MVTNPETSYISCTIYVYIDVNVTSVGFNLTNDSGLCRAYLHIQDSIEPFDSNISRTATSSQSYFAQNNPLQNTFVEIYDSDIVFDTNYPNILITIHYSFDYNNFNTSKNFNASLGRLYSSAFEVL